MRRVRTLLLALLLLSACAAPAKTGEASAPAVQNPPEAAAPEEDSPSADPLEEEAPRRTASF